MSTQAVKKESDALPSQLVNPKGSRIDQSLATSLSVMSLPTAQLLGSLGVDEEGNSLFIEKEESSADTKANTSDGSKRQLGTGFAVQNGSTGSAPTGQNAVFAAAGDMSKVQNSMTKSIVEELQNELEMMQVLLQSMEEEAKFWQEYGQDYANFKNNPSLANFEKVMEDLENHYKNNPTMKAYIESLLDEGETAYSNEKTWEGHSKWWRFWHGELHDPKDWTNFVSSITPYVTDIEMTICSTPGFLQEEMKEGDKVFGDRLQSILTQLSFVSELIGILQGGKGNPMDIVFEAQSTLMALERNELLNNANKQQQQSEISEATIDGQKASENKLNKQLEKTRNEGHGLLGWIEDLVKTIVKIVKEVCKFVGDVASGNFKAAAKEFLKATGIESLIKAYEKGGVKALFEQLTVVLVMTIVMGPMALLALPLMQGAFGKDMKDVGKMVVDAGKALGDLIKAGVDKAAGNDAAVTKDLDKAKNAGEKILANPALQAIADIAMVAVIIASAISGQYYIAGMMVALLIMSDTGLMSKATKAIAKGLNEAFGTKNDAIGKVLADIIVIALVTALSFGAGSFAAAGDVAADEAVQTGEEVVDEVADNVAEEGVEEGASESSVEEGSQTTENQDSLAKRIAKAIGEKVGKRGGTTLLGAGMALGQTSLGEDLAQLIDKNSSALEGIMIALQEALSIVAASVGGIGALTGSIGTVEEGATSKLGKLLPKLTKFLEENASELSNFGGKLFAGGTATGAIAGAAKGGNEVVKGLIEEVIAQLKADISLFESSEKSNDSAQKEINGQMQDIVKKFESMMKSFSAPAATLAPIASTLQA